MSLTAIPLVSGERQTPTETNRAGELQARLLADGGSDGDQSASPAWRAAAEFADADACMAIAGAAHSDQPPTVFGVSVRGAAVERRSAIALLGLVRARYFAKQCRAETVYLDGNEIVELTAAAELKWLSAYTEIAVRRIDSGHESVLIAAFLRQTRRSLPFDPAAIKMSTDIIWHCSSMHRQLARSERQRRLLDDGLSSLALPVIMVSRDAVIQYTNPEGARLLRSSEVLFRDAKGRLGTLRAGTTKLLHQVIAAERPVTTDHVCSLLENSGSRLLLAVRTIRRDEGGDGGAVITAMPGSDREPRRLAAFFEAAGLIKSEARFLEALDRTGSVAEASETLGLSEATGRTYAKRILSKLGLRNQLELGRFVGRTQPTLRNFGAQHVMDGVS